MEGEVCRCGMVCKYIKLFIGIQSGCEYIGVEYNKECNDLNNTYKK